MTGAPRGSRWTRLAGLLLGALLAPGAASAQKAEALADTIDPGAMRLLYGILSDSRYALRPRVLDDKLSSEIFDLYLDSLDGQRELFTGEDIGQWRKLRTGLDDAIKASDTKPAFELFAALGERVELRAAYARRVLAAPLAAEPGASWQPDRSALPRPADAAEREAVWQRDFAHQVVELVLAGESDEAARRRVLQREEFKVDRYRELRRDEIVETFLDAYARSVDAGNAYLAPVTLRNIAPAATAGLGMVVRRDGVVSSVDKVVANGPAAKAGLVAGERLVAVGEGEGPMVDVVGWRIDDVVERLRGTRGTQVRVRVIGLDGAAREVTLERDFVRIEEQAVRGEVREIAGRRIAVVTVPSFYLDFEARRRNDPDPRSASRDVGRLLERYSHDGVHAVLLDLRGNGGGALSEAIDLAGLFLGKAKVMQVRESGGRVSVESADGERAWSGALAVLVDERSAAATEIFAAAIQDHRRGIVVGTPTLGRGSVQNLIDLDRWPSKRATGFGQVKLTIAEVFRVGGESFDGAPVRPDLLLPASAQASVSARAPSRVPAIEFTPGVRPAGWDAALAAHAARIAADPQYMQWEAAWQRTRALEAADRVALGLDARRAEAALAGRDAAQLAALADVPLQAILPLVAELAAAPR